MPVGKYWVTKFKTHGSGTAVHSFVVYGFYEVIYLLLTGMRFALLQTKVGLASLLSKHSFHVCKKTPVPLKLDPRTIITSAAGGMWLKIVKRVWNFILQV